MLYETGYQYLYQENIFLAFLHQFRWVWFSSSSNTSINKTQGNIKMATTDEVVVKQVFCISVKGIELFSLMTIDTRWCLCPFSKGNI